MGFIFIFSIVVDTFVVRTVLASLPQDECCRYWQKACVEPCLHDVGLEELSFVLGRRPCMLAQLHGKVTRSCTGMMCQTGETDAESIRPAEVPAMLSLSPCLNYWPSKMPEPKYTWL